MSERFPEKPGKGGEFFLLLPMVTNTRERGYIFFPEMGGGGGVQVMGNTDRCPMIMGVGGRG